MMIHLPLKRGFTAALLALVFVLMGTTSGWAGTTGSLNGYVIDDSTHHPLVGVRVVANSPSQSAAVVTDRAGHFSFLSLIPDTYRVTASADGHGTSSVSDVTVQADQSLSLTIDMAASGQKTGG
jgi:hypothetical protein